MNQTDIVSLMAATLYAGLSGKAKPTSQPDQLFYDRIANQAWDLYNAVAAQRGLARYSTLHPQRYAETGPLSSQRG